MTKAKARIRAKARAGQKTQKQADNIKAEDQQNKLGHFDPGHGSHKGPGMSANTRGTTSARQGSARSK
ncbi:MAG: hypothetical protein HWE34_13300 [Methylocystaceae bacterium]|nr:hypothetical protein [Methylocystaceae bacterium]